MSSTITHLLTNFSLTKDQAQRYDEITRTFVWAATHPQVRKARLSQPVERGGINLVDISMFTTALRTRWYRILTRKAQGERIDENWIKVLNICLSDFCRGHQAEFFHYKPSQAKPSYGKNIPSQAKPSQSYT